MSDGSATPPILHFGGPDMPPRALRNLLRARIDAVPAEGEICWSTYYFRDRDLAEALVSASNRGVRIILHVEGRPRRASVNHDVITLLRAHGLKGGLHVHTALPGPFARLHGILHSKIYYFSHPAPHILTGSFNPSGNEPEDPEIVSEVGDQDRGRNLLVEFADPLLVTAFRSHVLGLSRSFLRLRPDQNRIVRSAQALAWFYPRLRPGVIDRHLGRLGSGCSIRGAISHLKNGFLSRGLIRAARSGAEVHLLVHDTERRVPEKTIAALGAAGIEVSRYVHPEAFPLHAKFLLIDGRGSRTAYFGSFNYNSRSRYLNNEVLLASSHETICSGLAHRFEEIAAEARS